MWECFYLKEDRVGLGKIRRVGDDVGVCIVLYGGGKRSLKVKS